MQRDTREILHDGNLCFRTSLFKHQDQLATIFGISYALHTPVVLILASADQITLD